MAKELYHPEYPIGSTVQVVSKEKLEKFLMDWKYHHPLEPFQLDFAGARTIVSEVGFYHGGDVLYQLSNVPGIWHEECLELLAF